MDHSPLQQLAGGSDRQVLEGGQPGTCGGKHKGTTGGDRQQNKGGLMARGCVCSCCLGKSLGAFVFMFLLGGGVNRLL